MPDADRQKHLGHCPHCGRLMRYLGAAAQVEPFWNRMPAFFRYPLAGDPLLVILICTLVPMLLNRNLLGLIGSFILLLALFKYTYAVITHTAAGHLKPPPVSVAFTGSGFDIIILQMLVFAMMGGMVFFAARIGGALLAMPALIFLTLALPASIILLANERRVLSAVNPINLLSLMTRIGWPYLVMYVHLILMLLATATLQDFSLNHFSPQVGNALSGLLASYFMLILFHMLGYLQFQYQEVLGYAADLQAQDTQADGPNPDRSRRIDADIDIYLKEGQYDRVQTLLINQLKKHPQQAHLLERLYLLLRARDDWDNLLKYHVQLLQWMLHRNDQTQMVALLQALRERDGQFALHDPELAYHCAQLLYTSGHYALMLWLLKDFHKRFADYPDIASVYLLAAQALANGLGLWDKASAFLRYVDTRCKTHPAHATAALYLQRAANRQRLEGGI